MSLSTSVLEDERIAHLEHALAESRAIEETNKAALRQFHEDLKEAYFQIARQRQKLDVLTKKLQSNRASTEVPSEPAAPTQPSCELEQKPTPLHTRPKVRSYPTLTGADAERIKTLWQTLPSWTKGMISSVDAGFLDTLIKALRPDQVYEVGVASGTSSALILSTMASYGDPSKIWLHSYDITDICYFDPSHAIGDATRTMVPHLLKQWKVNPGTTALDVPRKKASQTKSLYFIDANHSHPWPTLDLIALLPGLKPGDHVALHDINLPTITAGRFPDYGVQWLFEDWVGESIVPDVPVPNIGAIVIPEDKTVIRASLEKTLARPWPLQMTTKSLHVLACELCLSEFLRQSTWA